MNSTDDPILRSLAHLPRLTPTAASSGRVLARCHVALVHHSRRYAAVRRSRRRLSRVFDLTFALGVCVYGVIAINEAIRLIGATG